MEAIKPRWASWSFLLYAGGVTILGAASSALTYFVERTATPRTPPGRCSSSRPSASSRSRCARTAATRSPPASSDSRASCSSGRSSPRSGTWFGWLDTGGSAFGGFDLGRLTLVAADARRGVRRRSALFRFPLIVLVAVLLAWFFVTDLISGGGDWSAVVTFLVGLCFCSPRCRSTPGPNRPYGMWLHVGAGLTIGGSMLYFLHHGNFEWALIVSRAVFILLADALRRSSWAVLGALGILLAAVHFTIELTHVRLTIFGPGLDRGSRGWAPAVVFTLAGVVLMLFGGLLARRARTAA